MHPLNNSSLGERNNQTVIDHSRDLFKFISYENTIVAHVWNLSAVKAEGLTFSQYKNLNWHKIWLIESFWYVSEANLRNLPNII